MFVVVCHTPHLTPATTPLQNFLLTVPFVYRQGWCMDAVWMLQGKGVVGAGGKQVCWLGKCKVRRGSWCFMIVQGVADPDRFSVQGLLT